MLMFDVYILDEDDDHIDHWETTYKVLLEMASSSSVEQVSFVFYLKYFMLHCLVPGLLKS